MLIIIFMLFGPILFAGCIIAGRLFLKRFSIENWFGAFAFGHCTYIVVFSFLWAIASAEAQGGLIVLIPFCVDLPVSLVLFLLNDIDIVVRFIALAVVGTIQYAGIGLAIDLFIRKSRLR